MRNLVPLCKTGMTGLFIGLFVSYKRAELLIISTLGFAAPGALKGKGDFDFSL